MGKRLLDTDETAKRLNVSPATVKAWRARGCGPPYVKIAGVVRYRPEDLDAHAEQHLRTRIDNDLTAA